jgi:D-alanine-D-alanine ligase
MADATRSVIVVFGGDGNEHRVSVASAQNVARHLPEARLWYWTTGGAVDEVIADELLAFERPFETDFGPTPRKEWPDLSRAFADDDAVGAVFFLALHGGSGEDGTIQAALEARGLAFTGSGAEASRLAFDKVRARERVAQENIPIADACLVDADAASHERLAALVETHGKVVVKPVADGSSHGVRFVDAERELDAAIVAVRRSGETHLAEAFVAGRELTVGIVEHPDDETTALPCSEVKLDPGRSFDYEGKYLGKGTVELTPAPVSANVAARAQEVAMTAHRSIGCAGYSRTDVIVTDDGPVFLEINTLPGLTAASFIPQQLEAAGIPIESFLTEQLTLAQQRRLSPARGRRRPPKAAG